MKKLIGTFAVLLAAVAQAEFMQWTVTDDDILAASGDTLDVDDVAYVRVGYVAENGQQPLWTGHQVSSFDENGGDAGVNIGYVSGAEFQVDLTGLSGESYSYYIELLNTDLQVIGRSGNDATFTYSTYAQLDSKNYVSTGDIGMPPTADVWHGGSFTACPEPSSMALLALGAGLVGLRRKLKKGKKEKRA